MPDFKDFSRGINERDASHRISDNEVVSSSNFLAEIGKLYKRPGILQYNKTNITTNPLTSIHRFNQEDGTNVFVIVGYDGVNGIIYKDDGDGTVSGFTVFQQWQCKTV